MDRADRSAEEAETSGWPEGYFEQTAGALEGEEFKRALQGELPTRGDW